jgi:hypothetical protein
MVDPYHQHRLQGEARLLRHLLEIRFGTLPPWAEQQVANAPERQLTAWAYKLLDEKQSLQELLRT